MGPEILVNHNFIAGEWVSGPSSIADVNPSDTGEVVGFYTQADAAQARTAVVAAHEAQQTWQYSSIQERFEILDRIGTELLARQAELGRLLSREEGKTLREGIAEVARAGFIFKFFSRRGAAPGRRIAALDATRPHG